MSKFDTPDPQTLFRLPWTAADNAMAWLEPTQKCNITCDACFVDNIGNSEKTLDEIQHELDVMLRLRRCDAMLIAGGEPLTHPQIVDIVRLVRQSGVKPVLVTNAVGLNRALVHELKRAGVHGFTFHVDSHQSRPGWSGKSERELNELRETLAGMLSSEGGLTCAFNTTIFPDTLDAVPDIVRWAVNHSGQVQVLTLICVRTAYRDAPYNYYANGARVDLASTPYVTSNDYGHLTTDDVYGQIRQVLSDFQFCAYLGGTLRPHALKWVIGCRIGTNDRTYGYLGAKGMELVQAAHHASRGRFLALSGPRTTRAGKFTLLLGFFDRSVRKTAGHYFGAVLRNPLLIVRRLHVQSISVVQPVDILPNGEQDTCDGCPNRTYWNERLVPACRIEEYRRFGAPVQTVPKSRQP